MTPTRYAVAMAILLAGCTHPPASALAYQDIMAATSYRFHVGQGTGTAVAISCVRKGDIWDVVLLTADHVVDGQDEKTWRARTHDGKYTLDRMALIVRHPTMDAALVRGTSNVPVPVARICSRTPRVGESVIVPGYPHGLFFVSQGLISSDEFMSAPISAGNSGGPIWGLDGVIGISVAVYQVPLHSVLPVYAETHHMAMYLSIENIAAWLREHGMLAA